jgi:hypothetical protein
MAVTLAEQLQHQAECKKHLEEMEAAARSASQQAGPSSEALFKEYHCKDCDEVLRSRLTTIDITGADPEILQGRWLMGWLPIVIYNGARGVAG